MKSNTTVIPLILPLLLGSASASGLTKDQVLDRLDQRAAGLQSLEMAIAVKNWTDLLEEFDRGEKGRLYLDRRSGKTSIRRQIDEPATSVLVVKDGEATMYRPRIKEAVRYKLDKRGDGLGNLLFAFGSDRDNLEKNFEVHLIGRETIGEANTYVLELTPLSEKHRAQFAKFVLWLDPEIWVPVRQTIHQPNRDYQVTEFSDIRINQKIEKSRFDLKIPKDVKIKTL